MSIFDMVDDYVMNMLNDLGDDIPIGDFRKLWLEKKGELEAKISRVVQPTEEAKEQPKEEDTGEAKIQPKEESSEKAKVQATEKQPSEYVKFCRDNRQEVKERNPEMKGVDIMRELARMWKENKNITKGRARPEKPKKPIDNKSRIKAKDKKSEDKAKAEAKSEDEYIVFCNENRLKIKEKYPEMNPLEITRELAKEWKKTRRNQIRNIIEQAIGN